MAFLVVLESMTPAERVAFMLHDAFGYSFVEVAEIVGRTPRGCRQPGLVAQQDGVIVSVFAFQVAGGRIKSIWTVRNPEKLRPWTAS